jgi:hypothetical protein
MSSANQQALAPGNEEPMLIASMANTSYAHLLQLVQDLNFSGRHRPVAEARRLHPDLVERVVDFLTIERVVPENVRVIACSSTDGAHPPGACLSPDEDSWWISAADSMPEGKGREYVEFELSNTLCRLTSVSIKIPPLPAGPLSVRDFCLEGPRQVAHKGEQWGRITPVFRVQNHSGMQQFTLDPPGLDVDRLRIVCLSNQLSDFYNGRVFGFTYQRVGYFSARFD